MAWVTLLADHKAAEMLGVSVWSLNRLRRECGLAAVNVGGSYRYDPDDLTAFIDENRRR